MSKDRISNKQWREMMTVQSHARMDGWRNILTGLGVKGRDRRKASEIEWDLMPEPEADEFYAASDIARKVVDGIVEDAFREGYQLTFEEENPDLAKRITDEEQRLAVNEKLAEASRLARLYGGSGIIPIPRDVDLLQKKFDPTKTDSIKNLLVLSRWELPRQTVETDVRNPNFSLPKSYRICPRTGSDQMNYEVHHSWVLRFDGAYLPRILFFKNNLWMDSVLNVCKTAIRDYDAALGSVSSMLDDVSVAVMKMKNLASAIAEDRDDLITKRMEIMNLARSIAKLMIIDSENEDFQYQNRTLTGVSDLVEAIARRLVISADMPHTKLLGESPEGSNATGNSTTKDWYDKVHSWQENYLDLKLIRLWSSILSVKKSPSKGQIPAGMMAVYAPLWQEPASVQATTRYTTSQADALDITNGILTPEEVALSRYGDGEYSTKTKLAPGRKKILAAMPGSTDLADPNRDPDDDDDTDPSAGNYSNPKPGKSDPEADDELEESEAET